MTEQEYRAWVDDPNKSLFMENFIVEVIPAPHEAAEGFVFIEFSTGERGLTLQENVVPRDKVAPPKSGREILSRRYWGHMASQQAVEAYARYIERHQTQA